MGAARPSSPARSPSTNGTPSSATRHMPTPSSTASFTTPTASISPAKASGANAPDRSQRIDHQPPTLAQIYCQQSARQPGDIISERRATSSRNRRATSSEICIRRDGRIGRGTLVFFGPQALSSCWYKVCSTGVLLGRLPSCWMQPSCSRRKSRTPNPGYGSTQSNIFSRFASWSCSYQSYQFATEFDERRASEETFIPLGPLGAKWGHRTVHSRHPRTQAERGRNRKANGSYRWRADDGANSRGTQAVGNNIRTDAPLCTLSTCCAVMQTR